MSLAVLAALATLAAGCGPGDKEEGPAGDPKWATWPMPNGPTDVAAGAPNPMAYTINGDGTVTDKVTGLMWQQTVSTTQLAWTEALGYCSALTLAGHNDWRAPTEIELISLIDTSATSGPVIDTTAFPETPEWYFWSSLPMVDASANAWLVDFITGSAYDADLNTGEYMRCVRSGGATTPWSNLYAVTGDTVFDTRTKLTWERAAPTMMFDQAAARAYCASAGVAALGGSGWRVPTGKELLTLIDYDVPPPGPTIDATAFPNSPPSFFWSSSVLTTPVPGVLFVDLAYGHATNYPIGPTSFVRCVR